MVRIETLPEASYGDAIALWHANGLTRPWNDPSADLHRAVNGDCSTVLAALDASSRLIGTALVGHDGHRGWVYYLAVDARRQREGIGRRLMRACEQWLQERDIPKAQLMVRKANTDVIAFYASLGYQDAEVVVLGRFLD